MESLVLETVRVTPWTRRIFVKKDGRHQRAQCPRNPCVRLADDACWECIHNMRKHRDPSLPSFTMECDFPLRN